MLDSHIQCVRNSLANRWCHQSKEIMFRFAIQVSQNRQQVDAAFADRRMVSNQPQFLIFESSFVNKPSAALMSM